MTDAMKQHGAFSWNELMTTDVDAAIKFYGELFAWTLEDMNANDMEYTIARSNDREVADIMAIPPEAGTMPPMWGAYVTVDDVEVSAKQVESLGGKIISAPRNIANIGRFCVICDPQGAVLSLISYFNR